ncbi:mediator of RNA polymerase II transcription subunit 27 isoform X1 [Cucumis sativus]|uniref:Mediator of RNA polymerase II transcription subunit 27 n=1 Tax=Cucumis sativus TaxID=3659 RepID=A0A0A0LGT1_CUCSA|nr:mediator of RNA polymerase II transcription subunit 27 isoform X1 [Cucumis sativus]
MRHIQQPSQGQTATVSPSTHSPPSPDDAPPKQVALAMDRLGHAARLIADIRLGADRLLEALCVTAQPHQSSKPLHLFQKEDASMRQHLLDLRAVGKQLEESGVLSESLLSRSNSWGLHMPLVCPDGAVVAYAWKRQLAGQAGASAVDRTRLALKAFTDQKRRFFPHLEDENASNNEPALKKPCFSHGVTDVKQNELIDSRSLSDILSCMEKEVPELKIFTYERLDWLKQASALPSQANENSIGALKEHSYHSPRMSPGALGATPADKAGVIELIIPSVFRAVVSLHPVGSVEPDALAFFSPDERGSHVHARGFSNYHLFRHVTEHAATVLQYFLGNQPKAALYPLLLWICSYQNLFSKACSKCGRRLSVNKQSDLLLPPAVRPYKQFCASKNSSVVPITSLKDQKLDSVQAFHIDCFSEEI